MKEETAKAIAREICNLFEKYDKQTFFKIYDIIRANLYTHEKKLLP